MGWNLVCVGVESPLGDIIDTCGESTGDQTTDEVEAVSKLGFGVIDAAPGLPRDGQNLVTAHLGTQCCPLKELHGLTCGIRRTVDHADGSTAVLGTAGMSPFDGRIYFPHEHFGRLGITGGFTHVAELLRVTECNTLGMW